MTKARTSVTVREVATEAGVSTATVSRVLAGIDKVLPSTANRVRAAMQTLGYQPNHTARSLRLRRTSSIGIVLPGFTNQFFLELIAQAVDVARSAGYFVVIGGAADPEPEARHLASGGLVDGLVFVAATDQLDVRTGLDGLAVPLVAFDRSPDGLACPVVQVDNEHGARAVTQHLIGTGARRIAHIGGPRHLEVSRLRRDACAAALDAAGLPADPEYMVAGDFDERSGAQAMDRLMSLPEPPDAVFAANDLMAIGAMSYARDRGVRIPTDVRVAGFDGITAARFSAPRLTTYVQPVQRMARLCVNRLIELVERPAYEPATEIVLVQGELTVHQSTDSTNGERS